jgi:hypothetical protein
VVELGFLRCDEQKRLVAKAERDRALLLELAVDRDRLGQVPVDPVGRLAEEVAAVPAGRLAGEVPSLDEDDAAARLCERAGGRAAGEAAAENDDVGGQLSEGSPPPLRLRQNMRAPAVAPAAAITVPIPAATFFLPLFPGFTTDFTPCFIACFATGLAPV